MAPEKRGSGRAPGLSAHFLGRVEHFLDASHAGGGPLQLRDDTGQRCRFPTMNQSRSITADQSPDR